MGVMSAIIVEKNTVEVMWAWSCDLPLPFLLWQDFFFSPPASVLCWGCYSSTHRNYIQMDITNFSLFILSYLIVSDFKLWGDSLWELTYLFTNMCLPHGKPCSIKLNLILDSSFPCCAWLCCHTHAHHTCSMLLFHSATTMWLHHVINLHYACPKQYW